MSTVAEKKPRAAKKLKGVGVIERHLLGEPERDAVASQTPIHRTRLRICLEDLERHPDNRTPTEAAIAAVADSLQRDGQLEPILVRPRVIAGNSRLKYQIISGETRYLAAKSLGWETIDGDVMPMDDAAALRVLAAANAARQDLDPIATARLIVRLCDPIEQGGSGMSREEAAKMFALKSGGAASNLVRLLELPPTWLERVASGELPQTYARELLPLLLLGADSAAWQDIEEAWTAHREDLQTWEAEAFRSREDLADAVDGALEEFSRPVEKSDGRKRSYYEETKSYEHHSIRFKLTPSLEEELRIVELPVGPNGEMIRRATNCRLYDSFQIPAIKAAIAKKAKGKAAANDDELDQALAPKLSPKEQAAEDARRREEAAEKLAKRIELWRAAWLRELVALEIAKPERVDLATRLLVWQQRQVRVISHGDAQNLALDSAICEIWSIKDPWHLVTRGSSRNITV